MSFGKSDRVLFSFLYTKMVRFVDFWAACRKLKWQLTWLFLTEVLNLLSQLSLKPTLKLGSNCALSHIHFQCKQELNRLTNTGEKQCSLFSVAKTLCIIQVPPVYIHVRHNQHLFTLPCQDEHFHQVWIHSYQTKHRNTKPSVCSSHYYSRKTDIITLFFV